MYNNTLTSTRQYELTSSFGFQYNAYASKLLKTEVTEEMTVLQAGYILSIELKRQKIKTELKDLFQFKTKTKEIDFLAEVHNQDLRELLPSIGNFLKNKFGEKLSLCLELMEEEANWQTLFINIKIDEDCDWFQSNEILDNFFDNMFELFPKVAEKLNIDLTPNAF